METGQRAALAKAKRQEDTLTAEERQRAALAEAEQEAPKLDAIIASLRADMAELQVLTLANYARAPPLVGASSPPSNVATVFSTMGGIVCWCRLFHRQHRLLSWLPLGSKHQ